MKTESNFKRRMKKEEKQNKNRNWQKLMQIELSDFNSSVDYLKNVLLEGMREE